MDSLLSGYVISDILDNVCYSYKMIDSIPPILTKVFPDIRLVEHTQGVIHASKIYIVVFNKKGFGVYQSFNQILKDYSSKNLTLEEKIEALIYLFEGIDNCIQVQSIQEIEDIEINGCEPNYKVQILLNGLEMSYCLDIKDGEFMYILKQHGEGYSPCFPFDF